MIILGVTGSIGMGKSLVTKCFKRLGAKIFDADAYVHKIMQEGGDAYEEVKKIFPKALIKGGIDRKKLGEIVYKDPEKLKILEDVIHKKVRAAELDFIKECRHAREKLVVFDIPLLFEKDFDKNCDFTVAVISTKYIQKFRVVESRKTPLEKFIAIDAKQMPAHKKVIKADFIIRTGLHKNEVVRQVAEIYRKII